MKIKLCFLYFNFNFWCMKYYPFLLMIPFKNQVISWAEIEYHDTIENIHPQVSS
jgi:hypothetical protein